MKKILLTSLPFFLILSLASVAAAQQASGRIMGAEMQFLEQAAVDNMYEIRAAELAAEKASNPQVKNYAQKLVDEHSQVGDQLRQLAADQNLDLPDDVEMRHQLSIDQVSASPISILEKSERVGFMI